MIISMQKGRTSINCVAHLVAFSSLLKEIIFVLSIGGLWGSTVPLISALMVAMLQGSILWLAGYLQLLFQHRG